MLNKTKIVCTIGSQSEPESVMEQMLLEGMNVVRLNFAHGNLTTQGRFAVTAKKLALIHGKPLSIMMIREDLKFAPIRLKMAMHPSLKDVKSSFIPHQLWDLVMNLVSLMKDYLMMFKQMIKF